LNIACDLVSVYGAQRHRGHAVTLKEAFQLEDIVRLLTREGRQKACHRWCMAAFGQGQASSIPQRGIRLAEEAIEAAQAAGCARDMLHKLVDHIFDRPAGELGQELGGVAVTTLALAEAAGLSAEDSEISELARVMAKPLEHFKERNEAKNAAGFNVA